MLRLTISKIYVSIVDMATDFDGKTILNELIKKDTKRKKISLYLSEELYEEFKKICGKIPASQVMEKLMEKFIGSLKSKK